jgi:hypothetical protein
LIRDSFPLVPVAIAHAVLAGVCVVLLGFEAPAIGGVHPAVKPLKFALSIALLLGTFALIVPALSIHERSRSLLCWVLASTMVIEMIALVTQALRGEASHFNTRTAFDAMIWQLMMIAILIALAALIATAVIATLRPLAFDPLVAFAVRVGLWLLLLTAVSGFAMGGRAQHAVGGADDGSRLLVVGWSREHGDLRAPHFFAMHAIQVLPVSALVLQRLAVAERARWIVLGLVAVGWTALAVWTLVQALSGRPVLR